MIRLLSLIALMLTVCVTASSAFIRHNQAGLGCADWPACYRAGTPAKDPAAAQAQPPTATRVARALHRVSAMIVGLLAATIALIGWTRLHADRRPAAAVALIVTAGLAWLGRYTPHDLPIITVGNVLGGFTLAAAFAWIAAPRNDTASNNRCASLSSASLSSASPSTASPSTASRGIARLALGALALLAVQACLGVMVSVRAVVDACPSLVCLPGSPVDWRAFDPLFEQAASSSATGRALHLAHRVSALALLFVAAAAGARAVAAGGVPRRLGMACLVLLPTQAILGMAIAAGVAPLAIATAHNASAATIAALLSMLAASLANSPQRDSRRLNPVSGIA